MKGFLYNIGLNYGSNYVTKRTRRNDSGTRRNDSTFVGNEEE
jgi:hypothetical protein